MAQSPIFLERRGYRLRRLMDAVRLLPLFGLALWMLPLGWSNAAHPETQMPLSVALRYLFGVWAILVLAGFSLNRSTRDMIDEESTDETR